MSQDLFASQESNQHQEIQNDGEIPLPVLERPTNSDIMREIRSIRQQQERILLLLEKSTGNVNPAVAAGHTFRVESSSMKKPFVAYLKGKFMSFPWLNEEDPEVKHRATRMLKSNGISTETTNIMRCYSYASLLYTNWRNQIRIKLITTDKAVEQMYLDALQDYLFASFRMGGVGANTLLENKRLTIALRAFTDKHSLFKTGQTSKMDFWKSFQKAFLALDSAKWTFYEEKEIKKIEKANKTNEDYIVLILLKP